MKKRKYPKKKNTIVIDRVNEVYVINTKTKQVKCDLYAHNQVHTGIATCAPEDEFDQALGMRLARLKAVRKMKVIRLREDLKQKEYIEEVIKFANELEDDIQVLTRSILSLDDKIATISQLPKVEEEAIEINQEGGLNIAK